MLAPKSLVQYPGIPSRVLKATIHIVQKSVAANLLLGNLQIAKVGDVWANASLFDLTAYLPQLDMAKVSHI